MKCRHCGNNYKGGFECPVCGNTNVGKVRCPVCDKVIHHGQVRCSNCGSPTVYAKHTEPIIDKGIVDYTAHSEDSHTYTSQEQYDYKKDAYQYNQKTENTKATSSWTNLLKEKQAEILKNKGDFFKTIQINQNRKSSLSNTLVGLFIVIAVIGFIVSIISEEGNYIEPTYGEEGVEGDYSNAPLEELTIFGVTNNLAMQSNQQNGQDIYDYEDELYVVENIAYKTNRAYGYSEQQSGDVYKYVYVDATNIYYIGYNNILYQQSKTTVELNEIIEDVEDCVYLDGALYYTITSDDILYKYDLINKAIDSVADDRSTCLRADVTTNTLYYSNLEGNITKFSPIDNTSVTYDIYAFDFFVEGDNIYIYEHNTGFQIYNLTSQNIVKGIDATNVRRFSRLDNGFLYLDEDGILRKILDDGTEITLQQPDIEIITYQLVGDKIFILYEDDNYYNRWIVGNLNGKYALLTLER